MGSNIKQTIKVMIKYNFIGSSGLSPPPIHHSYPEFDAILYIAIQPLTMLLNYSRSDSLSSTSTTTSTELGSGQYNEASCSTNNDATDYDDTTSAASTDIW